MVNDRLEDMFDIQQHKNSFLNKFEYFNKNDISHGRHFEEAKDLIKRTLPTLTIDFPR